ncbi:hypothetical protein ACHAO4_004740, partial [Trichoderma viride]
GWSKPHFPNRFLQRGRPSIPIHAAYRTCGRPSQQSRSDRIYQIAAPARRSDPRRAAKTPGGSLSQF